MTGPDDDRPDDDRPTMTGTPGHGLVGVADTGAFLARLTRLDGGALVRLRASGPRVALWARLPWDVLVTREVARETGSDGHLDVTVSAAQLLAELARGGAALPAARDSQWRWPLPPAGAVGVESVATAELTRLAAAAAVALREASARGVAVGQRALRDALLDHVALTATPADGEPVQVPQRLVQAVSRMGFLGAEGASTRVCRAGRWVGISAPYGAAWLQPVKTLTVMPISTHPFG